MQHNSSTFLYRGIPNILFSFVLLLIPFSFSWENFCWNIWDMICFIHPLIFRLIHLIIFEIFDEMTKIEYLHTFGRIVYICNFFFPRKKKEFHWSRIKFSRNMTTDMKIIALKFRFTLFIYFIIRWKTDIYGKWNFLRKCDS